MTTNGHLPREVTQSERDLTKVTKVRVRTNNAKDQQQQLMSTSSSTGAIFKPRTKMKTTTMIINQDVVETSKETKSNVDVVRAPLNWQLVDQTASQLQKVNLTGKKFNLILSKVVEKIVMTFAEIGRTVQLSIFEA